MEVTLLTIYRMSELLLLNFVLMHWQLHNPPDPLDIDPLRG